MVDFERNSDVTGPLGQFQASLLNKDGVKYILTEIAKVVRADEASIAKRFDNAWSVEYETKFAQAKAVGAEKPSNARRSNDDILDEVLTIVRDIARTSASEGSDQLSASERRKNYSIHAALASILSEVPDEVAESPDTSIAFHSGGG